MESAAGSGEAPCGFADAQEPNATVTRPSASSLTCRAAYLKMAANTMGREHADFLHQGAVDA
ncbi:hypothetical protein GCM10012283_28170 [Phycicoccus endophyticus]|nr:hypothetical protein GCM10012283_28170 [Phycicoccus endophyticus]